MPSCGMLDVGKSVQVTVGFNPMTVGEHSQDLRLHYDTGKTNSGLWKKRKENYTVSELVTQISAS